jgi:hypothetical protein
VVYLSLYYISIGCCIYRVSSKQSKGSLKLIAEIIELLRQGWKITWKQKQVWLFSAFSLAISLFRLFQIKSESNSSLTLLYLAGTFLSIVLAALTYIGVPYLVYCFAIDTPATFGDAFSSVGKFFGRVLGCSLLGLLILSPFFCLVFAISLDTSTQPPHFSDNIILFSLPLALSLPILDFALFEFFNKDSGIRQTLSKSWDLFTSHFGVLIGLGIILTVISRVFITASGISVTLMHSGFETAVLSKLNYLNPSLSFRGDLLFIVTNGISEMIYTVFSTSVFALAYLQYREAKKPLLIRRAK